jgi:hypothetical protein
MIHKEWMKLIEKYSFIDKIERVRFKYCFYYTAKGKQQCKKLPLRANGTMVQKAIDEIRQEVGVNKYGIPKERIYSF